MDDRCHIRIVCGDKGGPSLVAAGDTGQIVEFV